MSLALKKIACRLRPILPAPLLGYLRRHYYLRIVKNFTDTDWEWSATIKPLVPVGSQVLDIGANVGYLSGLFARWVGPRGKVVSVEPIPATYDVLSSSMRRLFPGIVTTLPYCVSDKPGNVTMTVPTYKDGGENYYESHIDTGSSASGAAFTVSALTLDKIVETQKISPGFIKIDVEGHELAVIRGGSEYLPLHHPPLLIEIAGNPDEKESPAAALFSLLSAWGYKPHLLKNGQLQRRQPGDASVDYLFIIGTD